MRIVVADDHEIVRWGVVALLERFPGARVIGQAADGNEAMELARELCPDVLVMDVSMPGCGALRVTRQLRKVAPRLRIVVMSALGWTSVPEAALKAGANAFVAKDVQPDVFLAAVFGG